MLQFIAWTKSSGLQKVAFSLNVCFLFCNRVDDLDKELKVLTATHNALQLEASKKEAALEETTFYVTSLKQDNDKLQEVQVFIYHTACLSVCSSNDRFVKVAVKLLSVLNFKSPD